LTASRRVARLVRARPLAIRIEDSSDRRARKRMLLVSLISNSAVLRFYKYSPLMFQRWWTCRG
jgi:hypothetical protein